MVVGCIVVKEATCHQPTYVARRHGCVVERCDGSRAKQSLDKVPLARGKGEDYH